MTNYKLVMPGHMNHDGGLFGGYLLQWTDETAWMAAELEYPRRRFATIGMSEVVFKKPAPGGSILRFEVERLREGTTSLTYGVDVFCRAPGTVEDVHIFSTQITFVRVGKDGRKLALSAPLED